MGNEIVNGFENIFFRSHSARQSTFIGVYLLVAGVRGVRRRLYKIHCAYEHVGADPAFATDGKSHRREA